MIADAAWLHRLISVRYRTAQVQHAYFSWTEGNPALYMIRDVLSGYGDVAPLTCEVLRQAEHNPARRPRIHALWNESAGR